MTATAFLFPGQGAQSVGMGKDAEAIASAVELFEQAEEISHLPLRKLCFEGPEEELARTDIAQPAIFTVSAVYLALLNGRELKPAAMAGLSLGEYTALYAAGAMDFATAVRLVSHRGMLMQQAATARPSGMVSIIGLDEARAGELAAAAAQGQVLTCSNFNCPGQVVLSGQLEACKRAEQMAGQFGASGAVPLKVAGAFHSEIMRPAAEAFAEHLEAADIRRPDVPVVSNTDARSREDPADIRANLLAQLVSPVRWSQSMQGLLDSGVEQFYEIGPGRVLAGLMRRINRRANVSCINSLEAIDKAASRVQSN